MTKYINGAHITLLNMIEGGWYKNIGFCKNAAYLLLLAQLKFNSQALKNQSVCHNLIEPLVPVFT